MFLIQIKEIKDKQTKNNLLDESAHVEKPNPSSPSNNLKKCIPKFPLCFGIKYHEFEPTLLSLSTSKGDSLTVEDIPGFVRYQRICDKVSSL